MAPIRFLRTVFPVERESVRLFCIPYAGGSASIYDEWARTAPDWLQICPIELPGRGWLRREPLFESLNELAKAITSAIYPYTNTPYAIFGHSMGALLAYEIASSLESVGRHLLQKLFVSGSRAPFLPRKRPPVSHLSDVEFLDLIRQMRGTPEEVLTHLEFMDILLPILRSDFVNCDQYRFTLRPSLHVPITTLNGEQDNDIPENDVQLWSRLTIGRFQSFTFPGGHFFIKNCRENIVSTICEELRIISDVDLKGVTESGLIEA